MERDVRQQQVEAEIAHDATEPALGIETTTFSAKGGVPPVATTESNKPPTASERAYGNDGARISPELQRAVSTATPEQVATIFANNPGLAEPLLAVVQSVHGSAFVQKALAVSLHGLPKNPAPDRAQSGAGHASAPQPAAQHAAPPAPVDAERQKHIDRSMTAGWEQIARYTPDERATPEHIRLPKGVVDALERAWQDSLKVRPEQEEGGILVQNYGGSYDVQRGKGYDPGEFDPNAQHEGWTQKLIGNVHTHPYRDEGEQVPEGYATFSDGDLSGIAAREGHMMLLRSGPYTFVITRTKQFDELAARFDRKIEYQKAFEDRIRNTYSEAYDKASGTLTEKAEAGVIAVCERFHLVYYVGQGSDLTRRTKRPVEKS